MQVTFRRIVGFRNGLLSDKVNRASTSQATLVKVRA